MTAGPPAITSEADARALMAVLGKAEGEFVASLTAPLCWIVREGDKYRPRNGSAFFLDAGRGVFGVTACHVLNGWREDRKTNKVVAFQLGDLPFDPEGANAIIAEDADIDIATFRISENDIRTIGKTILTGCQREWPPSPPQQDRGVYFAGFPGVDTLAVSARELSFGIATGGGVASSVSELDVSSLIEHEYLIPVLGRGLLPENFDFRGISGGPMLSVIEPKGLLRSWALAGVIYEGPSTSSDPNEAIAGLEVIRARRAHFINPDGTLDRQRWETLTSTGRDRRR